MTLSHSSHSLSRGVLPFSRQGVSCNPTVFIPVIFRRQSSLSAIHQGLHRSEKARPQGFITGNTDWRSREDGPAHRPLTVAERRRARAAAPKPTFRIRKGKKDITEQPGPQVKSRRARFYDPSDSFGKRSLVYQLKTGQLRANLKALEVQEREAGKGAERRRARSARPADAASALKEPGTTSIGMRRSADGPKNVGHDPFPLSVPYTTAASQFLYGRSVVEAAIQASRRKLYKLYIYDGANRQNVARDRVIEALARKKGIATEFMSGDDLRLMDKMSGSRPHNGYVLEASPIPQLPVTGLGLVSEVGNKPGFHVELARQSPEEAGINGASDFIPTSSRLNPLVIVLDQVLDPGNLGAILRTASFLGVDAVAISRRNSASLTPVALKASSGASEILRLLSIDSAAGFLLESRKNGWQVYAAVPATGRSRRRRQLDTEQIEVDNPLARHPGILLVGSEGEGLSRMLRDKADFEVNIPNQSGSGVVDSLNVSVATGILCSAFLKHRSKSSIGSAETIDKATLW